MNKYATVFGSDLGCFKGVEIKLSVHNDAKPKFYKPRPVPLVYKEKVSEELDNLQKQGIVSPVLFSPWAAPIVPVLKKNGKVRLCGDYKLTINQASPVETYPLPRIDELFSNLSGGQYFSKLDLANAYFQLPLNQESKQYVTINTHKGLFQYNRLPFGVTSAPVIFQRHIESVLSGLDGLCVNVDDILLIGHTLESHMHT